ncbi:MAG: hypothetical protein KF708_11080 [Pirellulales bacterium]|nr:hypothetical protein [Pirellulales bacterium]
MRIACRALLLVCILPLAARGANRVEFVIGTEPGVQSVSLQQWYRLVTEAGAARLDIRAVRAGEQIEIITRESSAGTTYEVHGRLSSRGELVVPGARFRANDRSKLAAWIKEIAGSGPPAAPGEVRPFGLSPADFIKVRDDLSRPTAVTTSGVERRTAIERLRKGLAFKLVDRGLLDAAIVPHEMVKEELRDLSRGTALACLLRPAGLVVQPKRQPTGDLEYLVLSAERAEEGWPVGLPAEENPRETLPALFDFLTAEVSGRPASDVVAAVQAHIQAPILYDHYALRAHEIDPAKSLVSHPEKRTYYLNLLRTALFQAKLTSQLRVDETGKPFVWITTIQTP